jgi:hypothetical protein
VNDDTLEQLLREADAGAIGPSTARPAGQLAEAVRQRRRSRRARRAAAGVAVVLLACGSVSMWMIHSPRQRPSVALSDGQPAPVAIAPAHVATAASNVGPAQALAGFRRLVAEADRRESIAARLQDARPPVGTRSSRSSAARSIELQREEATLLLLHQGDTLARDPALRESAAVAYRQAVDLFPKTSGATAAKQRLETLN